MKHKCSTRTVIIMSGYKKVYEIIEKNKGFITSGQVTEAGLQRRILSELAAENIIYRVTRGIYALPDVW